MPGLTCINFTIGKGEHITIEPGDVVLVLLGPTGSGKTSFIETITGKTKQLGDDRLSNASLLKDIKSVNLHRNGRNIILVETPGFDNNEITESQIVDNVLKLLRNSKRNAPVQVSGILYFAKISMDYSTVTSFPSEHVLSLKRLTGSLNYSKIRFVTTMWNAVAKDLQAAEEREKMMKNGQWKKMLENGAQVSRYCATPESALEILDSVLKAVGL